MEIARTVGCGADPEGTRGAGDSDRGGEDGAGGPGIHGPRLAAVPRVGHKSRGKIVILENPEANRFAGGGS